MTPLRRVASAWSRFWFAEVDGLPLGVVRIGVAGAGAVLWAGMAPQLAHFYSDGGEFPIAAARAWSVEYVARFLMPDALGSLPAVSALFAVWGVALAALLLGWRTRAAAWANWLLAAWFLHRNPTFNNGGDEVFRLVSLYLAAGYLAIPPAGRALSLDRARSGAPSGSVPVPAWPLRTIQIQIAVVYLVAGFWKVVGPPWWDGSAIYYALANPTFSRFGALEAAGWRLPFTGIALAVAWWELLFPLLVAGRRTRLPALAFGVALHLAILAFMNIGIFPFAMLGCYPAFLRGDELRRAGGWLRLAGARSPDEPVQAAVASTRTSTAAGLSP